MSVTIHGKPAASQDTACQKKADAIFQPSRHNFAMTYVIKDLIAALNSHHISARQLVDNCLAVIDAPDGEGQRAFISTYHEQARQQADMVDHARKHGWAVSQFAGIPLSIKDLFDEAGITTKAG